MALYRKPSYVIATGLCSLVFLILFGARLDIFSRFQSFHRLSSVDALHPMPDKESWMRIYQSDRPVGYTHRSIRKQKPGNGFVVSDTVFMRLNTMGMVQDIHLQTEARLAANFALQSFDFSIGSGRLTVKASGRVTGETLFVDTTDSGPARRFEVPLKNKPYLMTAMVYAVQAIGLKPGESLTVDVFDPLTMGQFPIQVSVVDSEIVSVGGIERPANKIMLQIQGAKQFAWIDEQGDVLREKGLLGMRLEKSSRQAALSSLDTDGSEDLAVLASVAVDGVIDAPAALNELVVKIDGSGIDRLYLHGGRQHLTGNILTIFRENLENLPPNFEEKPPGTLEQAFLKPTPFIESNHPKILNLAKTLVEKSDATLLGRATSVIDWVHANLEKRPMISMPDALTTLENGMGDCNEHAVLVAALARAAGIPTRIETGLIYQKGRFYYHAWNLLYLGRWITADAVYNQLPADVSHIRLTTGFQQQIDLIGTMGNLRITVMHSAIENKEEIRSSHD